MMEFSTYSSVCKIRIEPVYNDGKPEYTVYLHLFGSKMCVTAITPELAMSELLKSFAQQFLNGNRTFDGPLPKHDPKNRIDIVNMKYEPIVGDEET